MKKNDIEQNTLGNILLYNLGSSKTFVNVYFKDETFWMPQKTIAELFGVGSPAISKHLKNIFEEGELDRSSTVSKMEIVQDEGGRKITRTLEFYNLDTIIAVGYRVNSIKATKFRIWATNTLREYIIKGFVINDEMLKNSRPFGKDYFDELLEKIREIRASERRAYQKITDIFQQCSYDYDVNSEIKTRFFAYIQNKLHYATTGKTAAEIISERANSEHDTMGLTSWKNSPDGKILKSDIKIAKNYLSKKEIQKLERLVNMYIDRAEMIVEDELLMSMQDWSDDINSFLENNRQKVLLNKGTISNEMAIKKASEEYKKFRVKQDKKYISDYDKELEKYINK